MVRIALRLELHADIWQILIRLSFTLQLGAVGSSGTIENVDFLE